MWHTVNDAVNLTGKSKRTLYRHMAAGKVSYRSRVDGTKEIETSELIRVYGALAQVSQPLAQQVPLDGTSQTSELIAVIKALTSRIESLECKLSESLKIEHKPEPESHKPVLSVVKPGNDLKGIVQAMREKQLKK